MDDTTNSRRAPRFRPGNAGTKRVKPGRTQQTNADFNSVFSRAFPSHGRGRRFNPYSAHHEISGLADTFLAAVSFDSTLTAPHLAIHIHNYFVLPCFAQMLHRGDDVRLGDRKDRCS
jgi:hypothetical protein